MATVRKRVLPSGIIRWQATYVDGAGKRRAKLFERKSGLRGSELRGLRWLDVDFDDREIHVRQRADAFHKIGRLKSNSGYRSIPMPPIVVNALREWKLVCPKRETGKKNASDEPQMTLDLVFPTHSNVVQRGFGPIQPSGMLLPLSGSNRGSTRSAYRH